MIAFFFSFSGGPKASGYIRDTPCKCYQAHSSGSKSGYAIALLCPAAVTTALDKAAARASLGRKLEAVLGVDHAFTIFLMLFFTVDFNFEPAVLAAPLEEFSEDFLSALLAAWEVL